MKKEVGLVVVLSLIIIVGFYYFGGDVSEEEAESVGLNIVIENVDYHENSVGYFAKPKGEGEYPGLILIHEWWGLNENIKGLVEEYAKEGYVALAVDLYGGEVTTERSVAGELASSVRGDMEGAFDNLEAAVDYLNSDPNVKENELASVGWCFGGGWSYEMAKNDLGVKSSIIYYGRFNPEDDLSKMRATILGHFGEDDASILVDDVNELQVKLNTLSGDHMVFIYPNSGHAFANEGGSAYVQESADLAWKRTLDFLDKQFS